MRALSRPARAAGFLRHLILYIYCDILTFSVLHIDILQLATVCLVLGQIVITPVRRPVGLGFNAQLLNIMDSKEP